MTRLRIRIYGHDAEQYANAHDAVLDNDGATVANADTILFDALSVAEDILLENDSAAGVARASNLLTSVVEFIDGAEVAQ